MSNLVVNGAFDANADGWTLTSGAHYKASGSPSPGCVRLIASGGAGSASMYQQNITPTAAGLHLACVRLRQESMNPANNCAYVELQSSVNVLEEYLKLEVGVWHRVYWPVTLGVVAHTLTVNAQQNGTLYVDTVGLFAPDGELMSLINELRERRNDPLGIKHSEPRYEAAINRAISFYPRLLWRPDINTSLTTVAEQRRYVLSGISAIVEPGQVQRCWMEDTSGNDRMIGRWEVEDDAGALTFVLDEDPPAASRTITLEYFIKPSSLSLPWDATTCDKEWVLARALTDLLLETDPTIDPPELAAADLVRWDGARQARELELMRRRYRAPHKIRTTAWGDHL